MSRPEGDALAARNADVISDWNAGMTQHKIAKRHGIGVIRVRQIMRDERSSITRFVSILERDRSRARL